MSVAFVRVLLGSGSAIFLLLAAVRPLLAQGGTSLPALVEHAQPAVVSLQVFDENGTEIGQGSGFLTSAGRVVTNAHVVEGAARIEVLDYKDQLLGVATYAENLSTRVDLAILPSLGPTAFGLDPASENPSVGEPVVVIGSPQGLSNTVSEGIVSAFREIDAMRWMQITAPISQGSSGGPVLNHAGQVVGVAAALMEGGQNINFAVPVADLRAVLNSPAGRLAFPSSVGGVPSTPASQGTESYANYFDSFLTVRLREPVTGALETTDLQFDSGAFADYYRVDGPAGSVYTAVMIAEDVDAYLGAVGIDESGDLTDLGIDDDGLGGTNSLLVFEKVTDGPAVLVATSYSAGEVGQYTLYVGPGDLSEEMSELLGGSRDDRWVPTGGNDEYQFYVDTESIRVTPMGYSQAWVGIEYAEVLVEEDSFTHIRGLQEFDCAGRRTQSLYEVGYQGSTIAYSEDGDGSWSPWVPESIGEMTGEYVCEASGR